MFEKASFSVRENLQSGLWMKPTLFMTRKKRALGCPAPLELQEASAFFEVLFGILKSDPFERHCCLL